MRDVAEAVNRLWRPRSWVEQPAPNPVSTPAEPPISIEAAQDMLRDLRRLWLREAAGRVEALETRVLDDDGTGYTWWVRRGDAVAAIMRDDA